MDPDWEYVADGMMGGMSRGGMQRQVFHGREAVVLQGDVSLDNNGGFVQIAFDLSPDGTGIDASGYTGIQIDVCGNAEQYDIQLRTDQLARPWQSFQTDFVALPDWKTLQIPFSHFESHKTELVFDAAQVAVVSIGLC